MEALVLPYTGNERHKWERTLNLEAERNKNCGEKSPGKRIQREIMRNAAENKLQGTKNGEGIFRKVMHCTYK